MKQLCRLYYRIPFSETDAMAIVHHSNHARYFERGRIEFLRLAGLDYANLMKRGMQYPVLEIKTLFKKPLVFDEVIAIETELAEISSTRLNFKYKIFSAQQHLPAALFSEPLSGNPSVLGETFHCCVNSTGKPIRADLDVVNRLIELRGDLQ